MSSIETTILKIKQELISAFASLDSWFDKEQALLSHKRAPERWCAAEILEHVMLTSHYLLLLIDKGSVKALKLASETDLPAATGNYCARFAELDAIAKPGAFTWERPDHMAPKGDKPLPDVRTELRYQLYRCLAHLKTLDNGAGMLYKTTMTVNDLGKLDVYEYIYFLALHARRHHTQLEEIEREFVTS